MGRRLLLIISLTALLISSGCLRALMNYSSSSFLANFSLEDLVKKNRSPSAKLCATGGMGGMGGGGGGGSSISSVGFGRSSSSKTSSFSCQIRPAGENSFDEAAFLASLKADVEEGIDSSGAKVVSQGSSDSKGFYFEYVERDVHGRVEISGKKSGADAYYTLEARLVESRESSRK